MLYRLTILLFLMAYAIISFSQCPTNEADLANGGTFSGTCSVNVGASITVTGDIIWQSGTLTVNDAENELAGFIISGTGSLTIQEGSVIINDTDGQADDSNIVVQNGGTLDVEDGATLRVEEDVTIESGGIATVDAGGAIDIGNDPTGGEFNVAGTLNVSGSISSTGTGANGNIEANGGTINIFNGGSADVSDDLKAYNGGTIYVETGGTIDVNDNMVNAETGGGGSPSTGTFIIDGTVNVNDNVTIFDTTPDSGLSGAGEITAGGTLTDNEGDNNFSGCGGGATCTGTNNPLPVELVNFYFEKNATATTLRWTTASEINNKGFSVEKSVDGEIFKPVGFVAGNGDSNNTNTYSFTIVKSRLSTYYRLKQIDFDGAVEYHSIILIPSDDEIDITIFPNPFHDKINLNGAKNEIEELSILDVAGRELFKDSSSELQTMESQLNQFIPSLESANTYFIRLKTIDGSLILRRVYKK